MFALVPPGLPDSGSMELILATFSAEAFGATVLAGVTASVIGRAA